MSNRCFGEIPRFIATLMVLTVILMSSTTAAATPANDEISGAITIASLPYTHVVDTTTATTDSDDAQVNDLCGAPLTNNSVWYTFTAGADDFGLLVDVSKSDFPAGVIIATGRPGALSTIACAPGWVAALVTPGTTYYVLAFDDTGNGGVLDLAASAATYPTASFKILRRAAVDVHGVATIDVSYTCDNADFLFVSARLVQIVKRSVVEGYTALETEQCDGEPHRTRITAFSGDDPFGAKRVAVLAGGVACNDAFCTWLDATEAPRLRPGSETSALPVPGLSLSRATNKPLYYQPFPAGLRH